MQSKRAKMEFLIKSTSLMLNFFFILDLKAPLKFQKYTKNRNNKKMIRSYEMYPNSSKKNWYYVDQVRLKKIGATFSK